MPAKYDEIALRKELETLRGKPGAKRRIGKIRCYLNNIGIEKAKRLREYEMEHALAFVPNSSLAAGYGKLEAMNDQKLSRLMGVEDTRTCPMCKGTFITTRGDSNLSCLGCRAA